MGCFNTFNNAISFIKREKNMKQKEIITDQDYYEEAIILREKRQGLIKAVVILSLVICVLVGIIVFESYLFQKQYSQSQLNMQTIQNLKEKYKNTDYEIGEKDNIIDTITAENKELKEQNEFLEYKVKKLEEKIPVGEDTEIINTD